ncbi:MAG: GlsB/YeaQ/YmgE family stress response membrane protein [Actinomycetota bacterium]|nr:GlsB/YeaQ/YmgE family stress response membrane protein [Actinomycetota bacterium]
MGVISWILLGAILGLLGNRIVPERFPGGARGTAATGAAGAFLAGAFFSLLASGGSAALEPASLPVALAGGAGLLALVRKADHAEPRPAGSGANSRLRKP